MLAAAIAKHLAAEIGALTYSTTTTGGNVFLGYMPSTPDIAVAVMPAGGTRVADKTPHDEPAVQVIVRGERHAVRASYDLARAVYDELTCLDGVLLDEDGADEVWVVGCTARQSDPIPMGHDSNDRPEWSTNYDLLVHAPTTHRPAY